MNAGHYVETWITGSGTPLLNFGWQCFTCKDEADGYETFLDAEAAGDEHARSAS